MFSDEILLKVLEEHGKKPSLENLNILKEHLGSKIFFAFCKEDAMQELEDLEKPSEEDMKNVEETQEAEDFSDLFDLPEDEKKEEVIEKILDKVDEAEEKKDEKLYDTRSIDEIRLDMEKSKVKAINECRQRKNTTRFVKSFLYESCELEREDLEMITEETEVQTVSSVINSFFDTISEKMQSIDTTVADRSRGDIASMRELESIQNAITQLETILERSNKYLPEAKDMIETVIKSMVYLNQYAPVFKDAYRNKKTLMILKYQSIILSIISSVSYLIASVVDFSAGGADMKNVVNLEKIAPIRTLEQFVNSVNSGEFKNINKDIATLREYYCELPVSQMTRLIEAEDMLSVVVDGINNFLSNIDQGGRVTNSLYKLSGVIILLFSLREIFYMMFRMKTKVSDMVAGIESFANINNGGGQINKLAQFSNRLKYDIEGADEISTREIQGDNKKIGGQVKSLQNTVINTPSVTKKNEVPSNDLGQEVINDITFDW